MVFISSRSGWYGDAFVSAYSGSKFALEGLVEGLRWELEPLGVKTILIEPGRFRTKLLSTGNLKVVPSEIPDYAETSRAFIKQLAEEDQNQPGDAEKGVRVIVDLVKKEGCAESGNVPFRLPLGTDCFDTIKEKCEETLKLLEKWEPVCKSTDF